MKYRCFASLLIMLGLAVLGASGALAQATSGNRPFNGFAVQFRLAWEMPLPDPVKLIEIGQVTAEKHNSLLMLVGGKDRNDARRKLLITHWDGFKFATDFSTEFLGNNILDVLLVGHFRTASSLPKPAKGKASPPVAQQIVTTEGIYEWTGGTFARLFESPTDTKLAILLEKSPDQLLTGAGDKAIAYEVGDKDVHPSAGEPPEDGNGYVRFGVGTQDLALVPGVRYAQSFWSNRNKWMIGLLRGKPAGLPDYPNATVGDRLVVYVPKFGSRDKTFWGCRTEDLEEAWRSEPLPGRVLDVRVGDPKNEGKDGILVLTAQNNDQERHLYFFTVAQGMLGGR